MVLVARPQSTTRTKSDSAWGAAKQACWARMISSTPVRSSELAMASRRDLGISG